MATYVMSDIHGCFDAFMKMIEKIQFNKNDTLILAGDYIDRGEENKEILDWIKKKPRNVIALKGNHDVDFVNDINHMIEEYSVWMEKQIVQANNPLLDLYIWCVHTPGFDYYGTIGKLIKEHFIDFDDLKKYAQILDKMPLYFETTINERNYIIVHAGYYEKCNEEFMLWAREEAYLHAGVPNKTIIAGHTPTIFDGWFTYKHGQVFKYKNKNKRFINIDCGYAYRDDYSEANFACIRLDDEEIFYLNDNK